MKKLLNISDLSKNDILTIFSYSDELRNDYEKRPLNNKSIGLIFEKYSTRTRLSFKVGIHQLGGNPIDINLTDLNLQRSESFEDTFKVLSLYLDGIVFRTDNHEKLITAFKYFQKPLINGLSDLSHPCQIITDIFTFKNYFNNFENLTLSWFGDMNNVLFSYFEFIQLFPSINLNLFTNKEIYQKNIKNFPKIDNLNFYDEIDESAIKLSDCIITDVYTSMNDNSDQMKESKLIKFQINQKLMDLTSDKCVFTHCLPANIGSEVTEEVINSEKSIVLEQAKNRLIVQNGILAWLYG